MAAMMGKDGTFRNGATAVTYIDSWSLNASIGTAEVTGFGDAWEAHDPTVKGWSGTASGTLDRSDAQQAAFLDQLEDGALANLTIRLYTATANYWSGTAIMESWSVESSVKDKISVTFNFKGDGALAYT